MKKMIRAEDNILISSRNDEPFNEKEIEDMENDFE